MSQGLEGLLQCRREMEILTTFLLLLPTNRLDWEMSAKLLGLSRDVIEISRLN